MSCRACEALKNWLPDFLQNGTFTNCLRVNAFDAALVYSNDGQICKLKNP
jgi:hypothetical protein